MTTENSILKLLFAKKLRRKKSLKEKLLCCSFCPWQYFMREIESICFIYFYIFSQWSFQQGCQDNSVGKQESFQQMMLGQQ